MVRAEIADMPLPAGIVRTLLAGRVILPTPGDILPFVNEEELRRFNSFLESKQQDQTVQTHFLTTGERQISIFSGRKTNHVVIDHGFTDLLIDTVVFCSLMYEDGNVICHVLDEAQDEHSMFLTPYVLARDCMFKVMQTLFVERMEDIYDKERGYKEKGVDGGALFRDYLLSRDSALRAREEISQRVTTALMWTVAHEWSHLRTRLDLTAKYRYLGEVKKTLGYTRDLLSDFSPDSQVGKVSGYLFSVMEAFNRRHQQPAGSLVSFGNLDHEIVQDLSAADLVLGYLQSSPIADEEPGNRSTVVRGAIQRFIDLSTLMVRRQNIEFRTALVHYGAAKDDMERMLAIHDEHVRLRNAYTYFYAINRANRLGLLPFRQIETMLNSHDIETMLLEMSMMIRDKDISIVFDKDVDGWIKSNLINTRAANDVLNVLFGKPRDGMWLPVDNNLDAAGRLE